MRLDKSVHVFCLHGNEVSQTGNETGMVNSA